MGKTILHAYYFLVSLRSVDGRTSVLCYQQDGAATAIIKDHSQREKTRKDHSLRLRLQRTVAVGKIS